MKKLLLFLVFVGVGNLYSVTLADIRTYYMKGIQALANNKLSDAEESFKTIIVLPNTFKKSRTFLRYKAKSYYFLGDVFFMRKDFQNAIKNYRVVVQEYMSSKVYSRALYKLGRTLIISGKYREGIALMNNYIARYDNTDGLGDNALYWIGRADIGTGDYRLALDTYRLILTKYPDTALAYDIRNSMGKLEELVQREQKKSQLISGMTNEMSLLKAKNARLEQEKNALSQISELLMIKQRLLEIKAEKVEFLQRLKENGGRVQ